MNVVVGLDWTLLPSDQPYKKAFAEYKAHNKGLQSGVVMGSNGEHIIGRIPAGIKEKASKVPSAAAMLALANQRVLENEQHVNDGSQTSASEFNWIVAQLIDGDEELYWVGAVRNGLPVAGADFVGNIDVVTERIDEFLSISSFVVHTRDKKLRYNFSASATIIEKEFGELVAGIPAHKAEIKMFSFAGLLTVGILATLIVLGGAYWGFTTWQEKTTRERLARESAAASQKQQQELIQQKKKYESEVRSVVLKGLDEGMAEIQTGLSSSSPLVTMMAWRNIIYNLDLYQSTWNMKGVACGVEGQTPFCTVNLERGSIGNNRQLLTDRPDAVIDGDTASYVVRGSDLSVREMDGDQITSALDFQKGLLSDLQILRQSSLTHQVEASKDIVKEVTLPPPPSMLPQAAAETVGQQPPTTKISINLGYASGNMKLSGEELWQISGLAKELDKPNVKVTEMTAAIDSNNVAKTQWTLSAVYFIRNLAAPVIPEIPLGEEKIKIDVPEKYRSKFEVTGGVSESNVEGAKLNADSGNNSMNSPESAEPVAMPEQF